MPISFNAVQAVTERKNPEVASACGISKATYQPNRKVDPGTWKLKELKGYYDGVDDSTKPLLLQAVADYFCH